MKFNTDEIIGNQLKIQKAGEQKIFFPSSVCNMLLNILKLKSQTKTDVFFKITTPTTVCTETYKLI